MNIENMRTEFTKASLSKDDVLSDPIDQFEVWFSQAVEAKVYEPNGCTLATCGDDGVPQARIMLLKRYDKKGFVFFTNYNSAKAKALGENKNACLNFFWPELERQIRITGTIEKITASESLSYFATRSRGSQIGAWVSEQSKFIESREVLKMQIAKMKAKFQNSEIPLPDFWGGFRLTPLKIEFWQGRVSRLHDRILYTLQNDETWTIGRLAP